MARAISEKSDATLNAEALRLAAELTEIRQELARRRHSRSIDARADKARKRMIVARGLTQRELDVMRMRDEQALTWKAIGESVGVSKARAAQIYTTAYRKTLRASEPSGRITELPSPVYNCLRNAGFDDDSTAHDVAQKWSELRSAKIKNFGRGWRDVLNAWLVAHGVLADYGFDGVASGA